ncbi:hypothetical protein NVP1036O_31 [Vibrio phage 1.036.O._10N.286.45.C3]|nr:hypothetical protein NVP1036O_31 [Vibrio phage 1.036.O._10N.286.45.C3]
MIQVLVKSLLGFGTKMLMSLASEKLIEWTFFYLAGEIVKSTKTKHDDKFYDEIKKAYKGKEEASQPKDY